MGVTPAYNELVGARLRSIRKQRGLSLQDVQRLSNGEVFLPMVWLNLFEGA